MFITLKRHNQILALARHIKDMEIARLKHELETILKFDSNQLIEHRANEYEKKLREFEY